MMRFSPADAKVIRGMEVAGITNVKMSFSLPGNVSFKEAMMVPISQQVRESARD